MPISASVAWGHRKLAVCTQVDFLQRFCFSDKRSQLILDVSNWLSSARNQHRPIIFSEQKMGKLVVCLGSKDVSQQTRLRGIAARGSVLTAQLSLQVVSVESAHRFNHCVRTHQRWGLPRKCIDVWTGGSEFPCNVSDRL